ncbi:NYN domain-containing protein [Gemmata sp. JC673]|uniref:NYN domain-containing protein n=1 Tax=Gemmata algarum TaxID=2975278 RepID=A0ABU5ET41_9BACT|nr:NYN domain-containing protein [Gemmata algarum]MDY3558501.1 NYN domain-containing protein [Gemmata algarum]
MTFLIDGYNLMFALGLVGRKTPAPQFERARTKFLDWLASRLKGREASARVVFDAQQAPAPSLETVHRGVRVRFAYQRTADDVIEELVEVEPKPRTVTVVSNDARIADAARRAGCGVASCQEFTDWLIGEAKEYGAKKGAAPEPDKPDPAAEDTDELLRVFTTPESHRFPGHKP